MSTPHHPESRDGTRGPRGLLDSGFVNIRYQSVIIGCWLLVFDYLLLAIVFWVLVIGADPADDLVATPLPNHSSSSYLLLSSLELSDATIYEP